MMEALAGHTIPQRQKRIHRRQVEYPPIGMSNKKCPGCGHKNKKCTCQ
jgi:DTW domain-containing protein YfiP